MVITQEKSLSTPEGEDTDFPDLYDDSTFTMLGAKDIITPTDDYELLLCEPAPASSKALSCKHEWLFDLLTLASFHPKNSPVYCAISQFCTSLKKPYALGSAPVRRLLTAPMALMT